MTGDDHLGDALAVVDDKVLVAEVDEDDADLATVVGIDGAGAVKDSDAFLKRQSAARTHLSLVARGQLHEKACLHKTSLHWLKRNWSFRQEGTQIHACRQRGLVFR